MKLTDGQQKQYLANVIFVARSDDSLASTETAAIDDIRSGLRAKKSTAKAATAMAGTGGFKPVPVGNFACRVCNLADMAFVAVSHGELSEDERELLDAFARSAGISPEQLDIVIQDARRGADQISGLDCPSCGHSLGADGKFCPNCGSPLDTDAASVVSLTLDVPLTGYAIEFCESTGAKFPAALEHAESAPVFESCVRNKKTWYLASWPAQQFSEVTKLASSLSGMRNRKCYQDGVELDWSNLFGFVWCAKERAQAYRPVDYCFGKADGQLNPWGCKQANLDWTEWANWFSYGEFVKKGLVNRQYRWRFDKDRIRHEAMTNLHRYKHCPHLKIALVDAVLAALPDEVEVVSKGPWVYSRSYQETPSSIRVVESEGTRGVEFSDEYYADGVRPAGIEALRDVLEGAFAATGVKDIDTRDLLG